MTSLLSLSGCAFRKKTDPFEGVNRGVFLLNKTVDRLYVKPIACAYDKFLPKPFRYAAHNFFLNLREIPTIINDVLQCKLRDARRATARFALNTTWGVLGLIDVATLGKCKIERHQNDFGLTLAHYGYKESVYLVLPFFNSCTLRDGIGLWVDTYLGIWPYIKPPRVSWTLWAISLIDTRAKFLQAEPILEEAVVDEYTFMRDAYLQHRRYQMNIDKQPEVGDIQAVEMPDDNEASQGNNKTAGDMPDDNELLDMEPKVGAAAVAAVDIDESMMVVDDSLLEIKSKIVIVKTPYYAPCIIPCINPGKIPNPFKGEPDLIIIEKTKIYHPANPEDIKGTSTVTNAVGGRK